MKYLFNIIMCSALLLGVIKIADAQDEALYQKIMQNRAPSIVTLRVVSKFEANFGGQGNSREMRSEIQGVIVDKTGLVMVSNIFLNPYSLSAGGDAAAQANVKMTPTSIKVLFQDDDKEYNAFLAATDTKLNLAFIKVEDLAGKSIAPIEFTGSATVTVGQRLLSVSRLSRGYDYAAFCQSGRINGEIARPRKAWMLEGGISSFGLPVYAVSGEVVGVLTTVPSTIKEDSDNPDTMGMMMAMRAMGGGGVLQPFLVAPSIVDALISQAKVKAIEVAAKRKAGKTDAPVVVKPDITKKPDVPKKPVQPKKP